MAGAARKARPAHSSNRPLAGVREQGSRKQKKPRSQQGEELQELAVPGSSAEREAVRHWAVFFPSSYR